MEQHNQRRRLGKLRTALHTLMIGGLLSGCEAKAKNQTGKTSETPSPAETVTLEQCTAIKVQAEMIKCFETLNKQNEAEIAALDGQEKALNRENTDLDHNIAEGRTTVDVLSKELEDIRRETREVERRIEDRILEPER